TADRLGGTIYLSQSSSAGGEYQVYGKQTVAGSTDGDGLGQLLQSVGADFDRDGYDDLLLGAAGVDVLGTSSVSQAGALYAIYGSPRRQFTPESYELFANRAVSGMGSFLVDNGTGRPQVFSHTLSAGDE